MRQIVGPLREWRQRERENFASRQFAPEETDNIDQTLALADRYLSQQLQDDAESLYLISSKKSQLLYRNLVLSKVRHGSVQIVQNEITKQPDASSKSVVITHENESGSTNISPIELPVSVLHKIMPENKLLPVSSSNTVHSAPPALNSAKNTSRSGGVANRSVPTLTTIYLTFDDGPSRLTLPIAAYLHSQGIAATFFALGSNVKGHEKVVRDTVALGHRVGNHTLSHDLHKLNSSLHKGTNEIEKTAVMIDKLGGDGKMVRIPYGASSKVLASRVASEGGQIFEWDIDSLDSSKRGAKDHNFIEHTVLQQLQKDGKHHIIMLFHDGAGHEATLAAIRNLVPRLKQEGYRFDLLSRSDRVAQSKTERGLTP